MHNDAPSYLGYFKFPNVPERTPEEQAAHDARMEYLYGRKNRVLQGLASGLSIKELAAQEKVTRTRMIELVERYQRQRKSDPDA